MVTKEVEVAKAVREEAKAVREEDAAAKTAVAEAVIVAPKCHPKVVARTIRHAKALFWRARSSRDTQEAARGGGGAAPLPRYMGSSIRRALSG